MQPVRGVTTEGISELDGSREWLAKPQILTVEAVQRLSARGS